MEVPGSGIGETSQPRFPSLNILLIENDPHVVATFKQLAVGHEVWNCPSTKSVLERLEKGMKVFFDVVILDEELPNLDAFKFSKNNSDIAVILRATSTSLSSMKKVVDCGGDLWLKPFSMHNIISMELFVIRKKYASSVTWESSSVKKSKKSKRDADVGGGGGVEVGNIMDNNEII